MSDVPEETRATWRQLGAELGRAAKSLREYVARRDGAAVAPPRRRTPSEMLRDDPDAVRATLDALDEESP